MRPFLAATLLLASAFLTGCAGSSGGDGGSSNSKFYGSYSGPWTAVGENGSGGAVLAVWASGKIEGFVREDPSGATRAITGNLADDGTLRGTLTPEGGTGTPFNGTLALSADENLLAGTLTLRIAGQDQPANFNLTKRWDPEDGYVNGGL